MRIAKWTDYEESLLRRHFPTATWEELQRRLPRHTAKAIAAKAHKLNLKRTHE